VHYGEDLAYIHAAGFSSFSRGAAPGIIRLLQQAEISIRRVIDAGCGSGILTGKLAEAGFEVVGIDASAELLEIARLENPGARFLQASVYEFEMPRCEAVIALGETLTYHQNAGGDRLIGEFFRSASSVLPRGGIFLFDIIELGEPTLSGRSWHAGEDWAVMVENDEDQAERMLVRKIETFRKVGDWYRRGGELHSVRLFDSFWISAQLAECGFRVTTSQAYGAQALPRRRRAFFATRER
jgi:SAM-dependent methyltransferase